MDSYIFCLESNGFAIVVWKGKMYFPDKTFIIDPKIQSFIVEYPIDGSGIKKETIPLIEDPETHIKFAYSPESCLLGIVKL